MSVLSTKDKIKLRLSAARVERWNRERVKPALNPESPDKPIRCRSVIWAHGQEKDGESIQPDKMDSVHRLTDGHKMRLPSGKLTLVRRGDNFSDYYDADYSESPRDPVWKKDAPRYAQARPDSPFKRAGKSVASVVVIRK